jgi:hypothetical protein
MACKRQIVSYISATLVVAIASACGDSTRDEPSSALPADTGSATTAVTTQAPSSTAPLSQTNPEGRYVSLETKFALSEFVLLVSEPEMSEPLSIDIGEPEPLVLPRAQFTIVDVLRGDPGPGSPQAGQQLDVIGLHENPFDDEPIGGDEAVVVGVQNLDGVPYQESPVRWASTFTAKVSEQGQVAFLSRPNRGYSSEYGLYTDAVPVQGQEARLTQLLHLVDALRQEELAEGEQPEAEEYRRIVAEGQAATAAAADLERWSDTPPRERGLQIGVVPDELLPNYEVIGLELTPPSEPAADGPQVQVLSRDGVVHSFSLGTVDTHVVPLLRLPDEELNVVLTHADGEEVELGTVSGVPGQVSIVTISSTDRGEFSMEFKGTRAPTEVELRAAEGLGISEDGQTVIPPTTNVTE